MPTAKNEHSHYVCDDDGDVKCLPGWYGDLCDVPKCRPGCDPLQGYCNRPGECLCKLGYYGEKCNKCMPLPGCQHGYCNVSFECICHEGWDGLFCSDRKYPDDDSNSNNGVGNVWKFLSLIGEHINYEDWNL